MISKAHPSWHPILEEAYGALDRDYRHFLENDRGYFPDKSNFLNAFTLPLSQTRYILFGQDPYPRRESAIGYAFIDGKVNNIFSKTGLSKEVNRATSLRNFIKMLLVLEGKLDEDRSQEAIAKIDKIGMIQTADELRKNFEKSGVMLLNTALIFTDKKESKKHIKAWKPFMQSLLGAIKDEGIELILFGKMADLLGKFEQTQGMVKHTMPHPYNLSFIDDTTVHRLFSSMHLLWR